MKHALICLRGFNIAALLDLVTETLAPDFAWSILHVVDTRPIDEVERALSGLPGRGPGHHHADQRLQRAVDALEVDVQRDVDAWLRAHEREVTLLLERGLPEHEIVRIAEERGVSLIVLGSDPTPPGPHRMGPVVQFVLDHSPCDVLVLRPPDARAGRDGDQ